MSPDRGFYPLPRPVRSEESIKRRMGHNSGYERSLVETDCQLGNSRYSGRPRTASFSQPYHSHQIDTMTEDSVERTSVPSVKSFSSGPSSRRDSAISNSSKEHRRRPKTARQSSKSSLKPGRETSLADVGSSPTRQRPRRSATSPPGQIPTTNIEEALALHERSRQILAMATVSTPYQSSVSVAPSPPIYYRSQTAIGSTHGRQFDPSGRFCAVSVEPLHVEEPNDHYIPVPATTTYWTSTETRRQEYAKIDKANKGLRGMFKKMIPKFARTTSNSRFFDERDDSDVCSVRRYRLDLDEEK
jgi:hypothetical protein